jgi:hypothetical protein
VIVELKLDDALEILERTPETLRSLLQGLPEPWLMVDEGEATFSPLDVLGHLVDGEVTDWIPRIRIILEEGEARPFTPFDRFAFREKYRGWSAGRVLEEFARLRRENLALVRSLGLDGAALASTGTHPSLGRVTLQQLFAAWVVHDLGHIRQIVRVMARQYTEAVGPWREYLPVLDRG